ncbi:protein tramtrack, beta isoform isoform X5 [Eurytemora carolleeae]|uniref:protein tramtrack, beta isoform isoform X5 n=1 Tax=Eurytemora carolleeae TaxID=1294199 RepID=UPI000C76D7E7|nr:protein tramtrack, beta isoform isoform X5 [Eurytemora carolleeae]|eukprot:XP_023334310.1 protein tramtrack, beta isoform-like isoform X5 [Eurytemora affinis]
MMDENYNLRWNDYEKGLLGGFSSIRENRELFDISLMCEDTVLQAHKLVLSACSPVFRQILNSLTQNSPIVYLRGVSLKNMESLLNFMYQGEVNINQSRITEFLATAEDLKIKGLSRSEGESGSNKTKSVEDEKEEEQMENGNGRKRVKLVSSRSPDTEVQAVALKKELKSQSVMEYSQPVEENQIIIPKLKGSDMLDIVDNDYIDDDFNYSSMDYSSFQDNSSDYQIHSKEYPTSDPGSQMQQKRRRQHVVSFISINKVRLDNGYQCLLCKKQTADNSNMNKHIEFTHQTDLKEYLSHLVIIKIIFDVGIIA